MTRIHLDLRRDIIGGTEPLAATLTARRTRIRTDGAVITYPDDLKFTLPGIIDLDPPQANEAWALRIYFPSRRPTIYLTVTFTGTDIDWADLTDVDPSTLVPLPTGPALAAWEAVRQHLDTTVDELIDTLPDNFVTWDGANLQQGGIPIPISGGGTGPGGQILTQASPSASWIFSHVLGRIPVVAVYDTTGEQIAPDVHASATSLSLTFANPMAGTAVLT